MYLTDLFKTILTDLTLPYVYYRKQQIELWGHLQKNIEDRALELTKVGSLLD